MNLIFVDNKLHLKLAPLTLTRPVSGIRMGILTMAESWQKALSHFINIDEIEFETEEYLYHIFKKTSGNGIHIAGNIKATKQLAEMVSQLKNGEALYVNNRWIARCGDQETTRIDETVDDLIAFEHPWEIFQYNGKAIIEDFKLLTEGRTTQQLSASNQLIGNHEVFLEEGARLECAILNTTNGPIYIGKDAEVMEGAIIRGPFVLCEHATIKMGAKMYGDSTIGPHCKIGGEVSNSIFQAYSNKGHDGFVGNSVIGEWCNLGADTNTSNLKNNYSNVRFYSYETQKMEETGLQFCGVIMGDHSKTSINTQLNTASSVGVCANIFGSGFPPKHIPSFSWGAINGNERFKLEKAFEVGQNMMKRRGIDLSEGDKNVLSYLYHQMA